MLENRLRRGQDGQERQHCAQRDHLGEGAQSFGVDAAGDDVSAATFFLPGMLAAGVLLSGLQNMSIDIA